MAKYIYSENRLIRCCFSSFCGVSTNKFIRYPSSQTSTDPTSDVYMVAFSLPIKKSILSETTWKLRSGLAMNEQFHFLPLFPAAVYNSESITFLKDKSSVRMIDNKIQDNTARKGVSYFLPLYFAA